MWEVYLSSLEQVGGGALHLPSSRQIADRAPFKMWFVKQEYSTSTPLDVLDRVAVPFTGKEG